MNAAQRREAIQERLSGATAPVSASTLAAQLGVSRQIVVGDVALLRAGGAQIDATTRESLKAPSTLSSPQDSLLVIASIALESAPSVSETARAASRLTSRAR